jgi:hypothetical protein
LSRFELCELGHGAPVSQAAEKGRSKYRNPPCIFVGINAGLNGQIYPKSDSFRSLFN